MNILRNTTTFCLALANLACYLQPAEAALPIDLEVVTEPGVPLTAPQEWARVLGRMDLGSVRLRGARGSERPKLEEKKLGKTPRYHLLVILNDRNELLLPGRRFRMSEQRRLQKYLQELPAQTAYNAEPRGRFGLTEKQFRQVYTELSQPVGFSTVGKTTYEILGGLKKGIRTPIREVGTAALRNGKPLTTELRELSVGTALAFALRLEGFALLPEQLPGQTLRLSIEPYDSQQDSWPIGWKPAVSSRQSAPQLYEKRNIEINGFTLSQALTALQPALKTPLLIDNWVLEQRQIDPAAIQVSLPKKRTFLKAVVSKLLSQARLSEEVRVDELEQPFIWVTKFGKNSLTATK